jgi:hypothetical protein
MRRTLLLLAITSAAGSADSFNAAGVYELGWTTHSNPNGVWSYGYSGGFTNPITLYNQTVQGPLNGPFAQYWLSSLVNIGESPSAEFNNGPAYADGNIDFLDHEFIQVAGIGGQYSDLVFTAPADGTYSVAANFRGAQHRIGTVVGVVVNGSVLFSSSVTALGQIVPFNTSVSLTAGQTIVFSVGPGGGLQNTGLSAVITSSSTMIPEPTSAILLLTGLLLLLGSRSLHFVTLSRPDGASFLIEPTLDRGVEDQ